MLDDLIELVLDLAVDLGGEAAVQERKKKQSPSSKASWTSKNRTEKSLHGRTVDPWDLPQKRPPWEK